MSGEQKSIVGTCQSTEQKPGNEWVRFLVEAPGNNYPFRLDTRDADVIAQGKAVGADVATWTFNEVESEKINPRNNKPYTNRYLEAVERGGTPAAASSGAGGSSKEDVDWDSKERRDFRSRAWAITLATFEHTIKTEDDPILVFERLKPFQRKLYEDVVRDFIEPEPESSGLSPADDDIPF